ncbi:uncharacterized protein G2W53_010556 [Senna tora]|uniref:Uncharacterized protein n=1 Tax=Senna tora TaxID=362788 RepID=A0A835CE75_9FABA|nr:uncharacterized protein G2W53_010556 [Senna tora]
MTRTELFKVLCDRGLMYPRLGKIWMAPFPRLALDIIKGNQSKQKAVKAVTEGNSNAHLFNYIMNPFLHWISYSFTTRTPHSTPRVRLTNSQTFTGHWGLMALS